MPAKPIITVLGAASTTFGPKLLRDVINFPGFEGVQLRLVDVNAERLAVYEKLFLRVTAKAGRSVEIMAAASRREALPGSDYVIISVDRGHYVTWEQDYAIPNSLGARQVMGELGGPGGLFHSLRQIPLHLAFASDIADLCPLAMVMVCSNPLNRICLAMRELGGLSHVVGLCHGCEMAVYLFMRQFMGVDCDEIEITAAGTNHLTWMLDLRRQSTGEDLYPLFRRKVAQLPPEKMPMSRKLMDVYGLFPATLDSHAGEYLPFAHEYDDGKGPDFTWNLQQEASRWEYMKRLADDELAWGSYRKEYGDQSRSSEELRLDEFFSPRSWADTLAGPIIHAMRTGELIRMAAVNLPNGGQIANLPMNSFVETPGVVDASGLRPLAVGALPEKLAAFNRRDLEVCRAIVEAAASRRKTDILAAALLDPTCDSIHHAEAIIDRMLDVQKDYLGAYE